MIYPEVKYIGQTIIYYCPVCKKELGWEHEFGGGKIETDCPHFEWEEVSTYCYYNEVPGCGVKYIRQLKQKMVLKIFGGTTMYLLVPKQS